MDNKQSEKRTIEKDYTANLKSSGGASDAEEIHLFVKELYYSQANKYPHIIEPEAAEQYDEMVKACDKIAEEFAGRMLAEVDYVNHMATITLDFASIYLEWDNIRTFRRIVSKAEQIEIKPLPSGFLRLKIYLPYFRILID